MTSIRFNFINEHDKNFYIIIHKAITVILWYFKRRRRKKMPTEFVLNDIIKYNNNHNESSNNNNNNVNNITVSSSKYFKIINKISNILTYSTAHGIPHLIRAKKIFFKLMWFTFTLISACLGSYFVIDNILDYLKYKTVTTIDVINEFESQFPTLSFCGYPDLNSTLDELILQVRFDKIHLRDNFSQVFEQFTDNILGKCYRYNSGRNSNGNTNLSILNSTTSGASNGLRIDLYLKIPDNYDFGELVLFIHNHSVPQFDLSNNGIWIKTGNFVYFYLDSSKKKNGFIYWIYTNIAKVLCLDNRTN